MTKNERGMTLLEVVAVTIIASIIVIFLVSFLSNTMNLHDKQETETKELFDKSYALKIITKDARRAETFIDGEDAFILAENGEKIVYKNEAGILSRYVYDPADATSPISQQTIGSNIQKFELESSGNELSILVDHDSSTTVPSTIIILRGD